MLRKATELPADEVFIDLEDAVAPREKNASTREQVVRALVDHEWAAPTKVVRVNAVDTRWFVDDMTHVVSGAGAVLDCIMLPKVDSAADVQVAARLLNSLELQHGIDPIGLEIQIESPRGLLNVELIAGASPRIETLIFGPGDYAASAGVPQLAVGAIDPKYPGDQWHYVLSRIHMTARAFGLQAIDGPYAQIRDELGFREVAKRSRALGFDGKWALHPDQIAACNEIYSPTMEQFERASRMLKAYEVAIDERGLGALTFGDEMIDEASRKMAVQLVARGRAVGLGGPLN